MLVGDGTPPGRRIRVRFYKAYAHFFADYWDSAKAAMIAISQMQGPFVG
jgi:hypothetical protein